jgi:hypothetical protein
MKKRFLSLLVTTILLMGLLPMPSAFAASTNTFTAEFNTTDAQKFLTIIFTNPVCGDPECTSAVNIDDFTYTDASGDGFGSISTCLNASYGGRYIICVMDQASAATDTSDTIYIKPGAIWGIDGGVLSGSGETVSPTATGDSTGPVATIYIDDDAHASDKIVVQFNEPVVGTAGALLTSADLTYANLSGGDATLMNSVVPSTLRSGSTNFLTITLDAVLAAGDNVDTLAFDDNSVYDIYGNELATPVPAFAEVLVVTNDEVSENPTSAPAITAAYARAGNLAAGPMLVEFDYPVNDVDGGTGVMGSIETADILYGGGTPDTAIHTAGNTVALLLVSTGALTTIAAGAPAIYDPWGNDMTTATVTVDDASNPVLVGAYLNYMLEACEVDESTTGAGDSFGALTDGMMTVVSQNTAVDASLRYPQEGWGMYQIIKTGANYADGDGFIQRIRRILYDIDDDLYEYDSVTFDILIEDDDSTEGYTGSSGALAFVLNDDSDDLSTSAVEWVIGADEIGAVEDVSISENTWTTITITLTDTPDTGTFAGLDDEEEEAQYWGLKVTAAPAANELEEDDVILIDNVKFIRGATSDANALDLRYSEVVEVTGDPTVNDDSLASTTTMGDMTTSKTLAGFGAFASGTFTTKTLTNTVSKTISLVGIGYGLIYEFRFASQAGGLITQASPVTLSGTFTPSTDAADIDGNSIEAGSTVQTTVGATLDLTASTTAPTLFELSSGMSTIMAASWTAAGSQTSFSHYAVLYDTSATITVEDSIWDDSDEGALATAATTDATITSLSDATYYMAITPVDIKGNAGTLSSELEYSVGASASSDRSGPVAPTSFSAEVDEDGNVVLTWTDPTDSDLNTVSILRAKGFMPISASGYKTVNAGVETYTDTDVEAGETVKYILRGDDLKGNLGTVTVEMSLVIEEGTTAEVEDVVEEGGGTEGEGEADDDTDDDTAAEGEGEGEPEAVEFSDTAGHWAEDETIAMAEKGIIEGNEDGSFDPDGTINRAEAAAMIYRLLGLGEPSAPSSSVFTDVVLTEWYAGYVTELYDMELVGGKTSTTYVPGEEMNRAEFLQMAMNMYYYLTDTEMEATVVTTQFTDVDADAWYALVITDAYEMELVDGKTATTYGPTDPISRGEAATMLFNMFYDMI